MAVRPSKPSVPTVWIIPAITTFGGLLSGILVYRFAPEAEGHGTDTAVEAFQWEPGCSPLRWYGNMEFEVGVLLYKCRLSNRIA